MPFAKYNDKKIYYEVHGELNSEPLLMLNGIMMSHASWHLFIPALIKEHTLILMDFFDQGQSDQMMVAYEQDIQVEAIKAVLDDLKLKKVNLCGISYGGEVAMHFALKYQDSIRKLLLFNTTAYTNPWLRDIGRGWNQAAEKNDSELFYNITIPIIYSPIFYSKNIEWMNQRKEFLYHIFKDSFLSAMIRLVDSAEHHDLRERIQEIKADTLVVSSDYDFVTPAVEQEFIHKQIAGSTYLQIKNCGHASMYERPTEFLTMLKGFLR
ncbi:MAG: alpha/beta hydrolase [Lachnospiraceae bacterium]|nr:alpha/beta hydrolase [Lachnospiraceae bacterium]